LCLVGFLLPPATFGQTFLGSAGATTRSSNRPYDWVVSPRICSQQNQNRIINV